MPSQTLGNLADVLVQNGAAMYGLAAAVRAQPQQQQQQQQPQHAVGRGGTGQAGSVSAEAAAAELEAKAQVGASACSCMMAIDRALSERRQSVRSTRSRIPGMPAFRVAEGCEQCVRGSWQGALLPASRAS